ncbi:hypothetical protein [Leifsonia shinshuensis]|uniref:Uncharacterized protein n=1 Tax=Leifsonia shinshuensis TaxID=150026 RepID=A0A7G6Y9R5_9MICO|nr:hypothetical protein [Leifsonia shinshuensis]QNE35230.1 hypothetical protein F1C12_08840 [Leifsonia shinshuensis]
MTPVLIPFGAFAVFCVIVFWLMQRNIRRSTRMHGLITAKRFSPAHGSFAANGGRGEHVVVTPDSWVLDIDDGRHHGHAVVSHGVFDEVRVGDEYDGEPDAGPSSTPAGA